jgi:cytochrome c oxidase accessory protein FixG
MLDEESLTVAYRDWRGEPRGKLHKGQSAPVEGQGDCIDCMACVNVCPMGIDIRNGQQLACITCALCIDACNDVMDKIGRPRDLIGYLALTDEAAERAGTPPKSVWKHVFRPRTILYTVLWAGIGIALIVALFIRTDLDVNVTPVRNPTFVTLSDGSIRNAYDFRLLNKQGEDRDFYIYIVTDRSMRLSVEGTTELRVTVPANQTMTQRVYLTAEPESEAAMAARSPVTFWVEDRLSTERVSHETVFNGKGEE